MLLPWPEIFGRILTDRLCSQNGVSQMWATDWDGGLPPNLVQNWSVWSTAPGLPIAAEWKAEVRCFRLAS